MLPDPGYGQRLRGLKALVGNTPLLALEYTYEGQPRVLYAKAENVNMTGSVKDRMALHILRRGYEKGTLKVGDRVVEATSGNTGISFSAIGSALGHEVVIFIPDWLSQERIALIRSFGATVELVSKEDGGFLGSIQRAEAMAANHPDVFLPRQFANEDNVDAHATTTGPEIWHQLHSQQLVPQAFVAGVGTGGTIMGVGRALRGFQPDVKLYPVEPASSPTLSTGHRVGSHRIQGISDEFIPAIVDLEFTDDIIAVDDGDAILMAQKLARTAGLGVGISSGANFLAAARVVEQLGPDATVVTVFCDSNKKYLSTDLLREEPVRSHYDAPRIVLRGFRSFRRVCLTCFDVDSYDSLPAGLLPTRTND